MEINYDEACGTWAKPLVVGETYSFSQYHLRELALVKYVGQLSGGLNKFELVRFGDHIRETKSQLRVRTKTTAINSYQRQPQSLKSRVITLYKHLEYHPDFDLNSVKYVYIPNWHGRFYAVVTHKIELTDAAYDI